MGCLIVDLREWPDGIELSFLHASRIAGADLGAPCNDRAGACLACQACNRLRRTRRDERKRPRHRLSAGGADATQAGLRAICSCPLPLTRPNLPAFAKAPRPHITARQTCAQSNDNIPIDSSAAAGCFLLALIRGIGRDLASRFGCRNSAVFDHVDRVVPDGDRMCLSHG